MRSFSDPGPLCFCSTCFQTCVKFGIMGSFLGPGPCVSQASYSMIYLWLAQASAIASLAVFHRVGKMLFLFGILSWYISLLHQAFIVFQAVEPPCLDALSVGVLRAPQSPLSTFSDLVDMGVGTKALLEDVDLLDIGIDVGVAHLCASQPSFYAVPDVQNVGWYRKPLSQAPGPKPKSTKRKKTIPSPQKLKKINTRNIYFFFV